MTKGKFISVFHLHAAGLSNPVLGESDKKVLFVRDDAFIIWSKLGMQSTSDVTGPPGVGKSVVTWAWACYQAQSNNRRVTWVHIHEDRLLCSVATLDKTSVTASSIMVAQLDIDALAKQKNASILIVDGIKRSFNQNSRGEGWLHTTNAGDLLVHVSSEQSTYGRIVGDKPIEYAESNGWLLSEYQTALQNADFWNSVKHNFPEPGKDGDLSSVIEEKFFYAGHSARDMFARSISQIEVLLDMYLKKVNNASDLLAGTVGQAASEAVNHLMTCIRKQNLIVSQYVSRQLVERTNDEFFKLARSRSMVKGAEPFDGWLFELEFYHLLRQGPVTVFSRNSKNGQFDVPVSWFSNGVPFTFSSINIITGQPEVGQWYIPAKFNEGCFGAFVQSAVGHWKFVNLTNRTEHDIKADYLVLYLYCIDWSHIFVVHSDSASQILGLHDHLG